jgi:DeoR family glycerol-3-phosphate regulon repressor
MKPVVRQAKIIDILRENGRTNVHDLARHFGTSRETIRRDLSALSKEHKIQKIHGGATIARITGEGSFQERMGKNVQAKRRIGKEAAKLFSPGDTVFIDTGSTSVYFAEEIADINGLTIITNSTLSAKVISQTAAGNRVFLLGGEYNGDNQETFGTLAVTQIQSFRAHYVVLTIGALDCSNGVMDYSIDEAQVARAMIDQSQSLIVLVDHSKFDSIDSFEVCSLDKIDVVVCDKVPTGDLYDALTERDVTIIEAAS